MMVGLTMHKMPKHIKMTLREWRQLKRRQLRVARVAAKELLQGCFYTPSRGECGEILRHLDILQEKFKQKNWKGVRSE